MASTLTSGTLTVNIKEECILDGSDVGKARGYTPSSSVREFAHLFRKLTAAYLDLVEFKSSPTESGSQFDADQVKYVRITNLDNSDNVALAIHYGSSSVFSWLLRPGETFMMGNPLAAAFEAEGAPTRDITKIRARGISATPDVELIVGSE